jgi:hypothetical protein
MRPNHLAAAPLVLFSCVLLAASCVQSPSSTPETDGAAGGAPTLETDGAAGGAPTPDIPGIPKWRAYIGAPKGHHARYGAASTRPDVVDEHAYIVLVPPPDGRPPPRIPLFLRQAWRYGDLYFERMNSQMGLTPLDWLGIQMAIDGLERHPRLLPPSSTYSLIISAFEEGPPTISLPSPLPGDDHQGPGSTTGGGRPGGGGTVPHPMPPPPMPDDTSPPPLPAAPPGMERLSQNGIFPGDWPYAGWVPPNRPEDASYPAQPGETKELIRCEGHIFVAYKSNCIDFEQATPGVKWTAKIGDFFQKKGESWRVAIRHAVWNDGRNPQCTQSAQGIAKIFCYGEVGAAAMICAGIPGCVPAILSGTGFVIGVATGEAVGACKQAIEGYAVQNICDHRGAT